MDPRRPDRDGSCRRQGDDDPFSPPAPNGSRGQSGAPRARHITAREIRHLVHERMRQHLEASAAPSPLATLEPPSTAPSTVHSPSSHSRVSHSVADFSQVPSPMSSSDGTSLHFRSHSHSHSQSQSRRSSTQTSSHVQVPFAFHRNSRNSSISTPPSGPPVASNQSFSADSTPYAHQYAMLASQLAQHGKHIVRHSHNQPPRALTEVDLQPVRRLSISSRARLAPMAPRKTNLPISGGSLAPSSVLGISMGPGLKSPLEQKHVHDRQRDRDRGRDRHIDRDASSVFSPPQLVSDSAFTPIDGVGIRPVALPPSRARVHQPVPQPPAIVGPLLDEDSEPDSAPFDMLAMQRALKSPSSASDMRGFDPLGLSPINPHTADPRLWSPLSSSSSAATSCLSPPPQMQGHAMVQDALNGGMSPNQWGRLLTNYRNNTSSHDRAGHEQDDTDPRGSTDLPPDPNRR